MVHSQQSKYLTTSAIRRAFRDADVRLKGQDQCRYSAPRQKRMAAPFDEKVEIFTGKLEDQFVICSELNNLIREISKGIEA